MATERMQIDASYLPINISQLYAVMTKFGGYSVGIAQIDDQIKEKTNFPVSTMSLLASSSDMHDMRCFSIGGMKKQHDAFLESVGTTEEIIISLTRLPSTPWVSFSFFSILLLKLWVLFFSALLKFWLSRKTLTIENTLCRITT